jgi:fructose-1,6-bisphosphatase/inositol monophosphatase family enzyme
LSAIGSAVAALMRATADAVVLPRYQTLSSHQIEEKSPGELVTIADRESEEMLSQGLALLLPDAAIIGEEACAADPALINTLGQQLAWIIDPIDGTANFAAGKPPFALMVALVDGGRAQAGWIYDPLTQRLCAAELGQGAFINGERVFARGSGEALPVAGISTYFMNAADRETCLANATGKMTLVDIPRCAGEQYPRIALGGNDIALFERTLPWDHVPGTLFLEEAGGKVARLDGRHYDFWDQRTGLLGACSPQMWDHCARILQSKL